ncbi:hypothetical protein FJQ54_14690 [Sandaracinobacter neustonicus]|uniref:Uncharacterized protein n=1 Tax=Sandaracinobacter neustonicus TaxID=1715348 RepID=A0A501XET7_9SPHN|nr:hypothetical protein [Sandaracinobacter neustonicus]TPE59045.1 hypothetical protein FJQ54_14690 [Sandaracinobacter neustonicus]
MAEQAAAEWAAGYQDCADEAATLRAELQIAADAYRKLERSRNAWRALARSWEQECKRLDRLEPRTRVRVHNARATPSAKRARWWQP